MSKFFALLLFSFSLFNAYTQVVGSRDNSALSPTEVKPTELSGGGFAGDVNVFNGSYNATYPLGSVTTPSGLSYGVNLSYSASYSAGTTPSVCSGIPYGEGWNVGIPMITASNAAYFAFLSEYECWLLGKPTKDTNNYYKQLVPVNDSYKEARALNGDVFWFSPKVTIPGVASGRAVFKYIDQSDANCAVFVLNKFERYVELRYYGSKWEVLLDNGDTYTMNIPLVTYRSPTNQRVLNYNNYTKNVDNEVSEINVDNAYDNQLKDATLNSIAPKQAYTSWYCSVLTNKNTPNQLITFEYEKFGAFNYFQEFEQPILANQIETKLNPTSLGGGTPTNYTAYTDVLLTKLTSYAENIQFEILDLAYALIDQIGSRMLDPADTEVERMDSLYASKVIYTQGVGDGTFENWNRYYHGKSPGAYNLAPGEPTINNYNPYLTSGANGGVGSGYIREEVTDGSPSIGFNHAFLESPRILQNTSELVAGDIYEIRTRVSDSNGDDPSMGTGTLDFAVVTGDLGFEFAESFSTDITAPCDSIVHTPFSNGQSYNTLNETDGGGHFYSEKNYELTRSEKVFTTQNQAIKWQIPQMAAGINTSNFFVMPDIPASYKGVNLQIGPGNAAVEHALPNFELDIRQAKPGEAGVTYPSAYSAYSHIIAGSMACYAPIPAAFGIGMPWGMTAPLYTNLMGGVSSDGPTHTNAYKFWWNKRYEDTYAWANEPTKFNENVYLQEVEVVRYSKVPYMLKKVEAYRVNGAVSSVTDTAGTVLTASQEFEYSYQSTAGIENYPYASVNIDTITSDCSAWRLREDTLMYAYTKPQYIYTLDRVKTIPVAGWKDEPRVAESYADSTLLQTEFEYDWYGFEPGEVLVFDREGHPGRRTRILTKYIDQLGGETHISYYPRQSKMTLKEGRYTGIQKCAAYNADPIMGQSFAFDIHPAVQYLTKLDEKDNTTALIPAEPLKRWEYIYDTTQLIYESFDYNLTPHFKGGYVKAYSKGFAETTVLNPVLESGEQSYTKYYHHGNVYAPALVDGELIPDYSTSEEYLYFGKPKKIEQYNHLGQLEEESIYHYGHTKAYENGFARNRMYRTNLLSPLDYDKHTNYVHLRDYEYSDYRTAEEDTYGRLTGSFWVRFTDRDTATDLSYLIGDTLIKESLNQKLALAGPDSVMTHYLIDFLGTIPLEYLKLVPAVGDYGGITAKQVMAERTYLGETWGGNNEQAKFLETYFYDDLHATNPDFYFHSYFIKTEKQVNRSYDNYQSITSEAGIDHEVLFEAEEVAAEPHGGSFDNPIITTKYDSDYIATIASSTTGTDIVTDLVLKSPLSEHVLTAFVNKIGQFKSEVIRQVLVAQPRLSDPILLRVFSGSNALLPGDALAIYNAQPYLSDNFLHQAAPQAAQVQDELLTQIYLRNPFLADTVLISMLKAPNFSQHVLKTVLTDQKQGSLSAPVLKALVNPANNNAGFAMERILLHQPVLTDEILKPFITNPNASENNVVMVYNSTPVYPSDNALIALMHRSPKIKKNDVVALLRASDRYFGDSLNATIAGLPEFTAEDIAEIDSAQDDIRPFDHLCNTTPSTSRNFIETVTEYDYYEANYDGTTIAKGYKKLLNLQDVEGKIVPKAYLETDKDVVLTSISLKHQPSWQLFKEKTYSPDYPNAFEEKEYYYYFDLLNRMSRHYEYYDLASGNFFRITDTVLYPEEPAVFNTKWANDHAVGEPYAGHLPLTAVTRNVQRNNLRDLVFQTTVRSKNNSTAPVLERSEYYEYSNLWNPKAPITTTTVNYDGPGCPTGGGAEATGCVWIKYLGSMTDVWAQVPRGHCLFSAHQGYYACPPGVDFGATTADASFIGCKNEMGEAEDVEGKALYVGGVGELSVHFKRFVVQLDTLPQPFFKTDSALYKRKIDANNTSVLDFYLGTAVDSLDRRKSFAIYPYDTLSVRTIDERNRFAQVQLEHNQSGIYTRYYFNEPTRTYYRNTNNAPDCFGFGNYSVYTNKNMGLPNRITVGYGRTDSLATTYAYCPNFSIDSLVNPLQHTMHYTYDDYDRLHEVYGNGNLISRNTYNYWKRDTSLNFAQRTAQNYVESYIYNTPYTGAGFKGEHIRAFIDPLGRNYSTTTAIDGDSTQIHSGTTTYDNWGRVKRSFKPYKLTAQTQLKTTQDTTLAYTQSMYENTPKGRTLRTAKHGISLADEHTIKQNYSLINEVILACELDLNSREAKELIQPNLFGGTVKFVRTETEDEDGKKMLTYTNAIGQQIATKQYGESESDWLVTLFLYDQYGNVTTTVNPKKQRSNYLYNMLGQLVQQTTVDAGTTKYMYNKQGLVAYEQDELGRQGAIPIGQTDSTAYFRRYTYDDFGRLLKQELVFKNENWLNNPNMDPLFYCDTAVNVDPTTGEPVFSDGPTDNFFSYTFTNNSTYDWMARFEQTGTTGIPPSPVVKIAVPTKAITLMSAHPQLEKWWSYGTDTSHHALGKVKELRSYDTNGKPITQTKLRYNANEQLAEELIHFNPTGVWGGDNSQTITAALHYPSYNLRGSALKMQVDIGNDGHMDVNYSYLYDDWNRLTEIYVSYNAAEQGQLVVSYAYDDALGLLTQTKHYINANCGAEAIQTIAYSYDIRDRLTQMHSELFDYKLYYDDQTPSHADFGTSVAHSENWNGNINGTVATYTLGGTVNAPDNFEKATVYGYKYDGVNRLIQADALAGDVVNPAKPNTFGVGDVLYSYDKIGNITHLKRGTGIDEMGDLLHEEWNYRYATHKNWLHKVEGVGSTANRHYAYDGNGNLTQDDYRQIENVSYGRKNYPFALTKDDAEIDYLYSVDDQRIFKRVKYATDSTKEYYLKNVGHLNIDKQEWTWYVQGADRVAKVIPTEDQQPKNVATTPVYELNDTINRQYYLYDHLGNTRVVYGTTGSDCVGDLEYTVAYVGDYYPYGKTLREYSNGSVEKYLTTQHERDVETGLDYRGARFYDGDVGRFLSLDPLAANYPSLSDYCYVAGNPVIFIDPDGKATDDYYVNLETGKIVHKEGSEERMMDEGLVHLAGDDASVGDIEQALTDKGFNFLKDPAADGGFLIDTQKEYQGWAMSQIFNPDIVGSVLTIGLGTGGKSAIGGVVGTSKIAQKVTSGRVAMKQLVASTGRKGEAFNRTLVGTSVNNTTKQAEHIVGSKPYLNRIKVTGKFPSVLTENPNLLLRDFHAGKGTVVSNNIAHKSVIVKFEKPIGNVIDPSTGNIITQGTHYGAIKYGKNVHITPVNWSP